MYDIDLDLKGFEPNASQPLSLNRPGMNWPSMHRLVLSEGILVTLLMQRTVARTVIRPQQVHSFDSYTKMFYLAYNM